MCQMTLINPASLAADSPDNHMFCYIGLEVAVALDEGFYLFPWPVGKQRQPRPASEQPLPACPSSQRGEPGSAGRAECRRKTREPSGAAGGAAAMPPCRQAMPPCRVSHRQPLRPPGLRCRAGSWEGAADRAGGQRATLPRGRGAAELAAAPGPWRTSSSQQQAPTRALPRESLRLASPDLRGQPPASLPGTRRDSSSERSQGRGPSLPAPPEKHAAPMGLAGPPGSQTLLQESTEA